MDKFEMEHPRLTGKMPPCVESHLPRFINRVEKYFKLPSKIYITVIGFPHKPVHKEEK
jgi:hypothetical protein